MTVVLMGELSGTEPMYDGYKNVGVLSLMSVMTTTHSATA